MSSDYVLITGGCGYIGAHIANASKPLDSQDFLSLDDLSSGFEERLPAVTRNVQVSLQDLSAVGKVFKESKISHVLHLAAKKRVGESVERPDYYWQENVIGFQNLLNVMLEYGVQNLVFSSSASVYGQSQLETWAQIGENDMCKPINPYGETKLEGERLARKFAQKHGFKVVALRYFNAAGAGRKDLGDRFSYNLIPIVFEAIDRGEQPIIFGDDYNTVDGTCIRDYIHVQDLVDAHMAAIEFVNKSKSGFHAINIGTGVGSSVFEVIDMISEVTGNSIKPRVVGRRLGDPASLVADVSKAKKELDWESKYDLRDIVSSAWKAWRFDHDQIL